MGAGPLLCGLDIGASRIKALLVDEDGQPSGFAATPTPFSPARGGIETTVDDLLAAVAGALAGLGPRRRRVAAVGIAGLAESGAPLDRHGTPLAPVIAWHDPRGGQTVARLQRRFGDALAHRIGQRARTVSSAAKLGWLVDHGVGGVDRWLGVPELCAAALAGTGVTEHSLAARTGWYDVGERRYLPEVAEAVGVPASAFPPVVPAGTAAGTVGAGGATWSGLPEGVPVTVAGHDHLVGVAGAGVGWHGDLVNSVGTAETVVTGTSSLPDPARALDLGVAVTVAPGGAGWAVLAGAARAGLVLAGAARLLGQDPAELDARAESGLWAGGGPDDTGRRLVAALQAGERPALTGPPGQVWGQLLGALAERTAEAVGRVVELLGPSDRLVAVGGGSRSRPWLRAKAARVGMEVWRSPVGEAVARGAAVAAGVAAGWWPDLEGAPPVDLEAVRI